MKSEDYFERRVWEFEKSIIDAACNGDKEHLHLLLRMFAKEVERDTRHKAAEVAGALHQQILNMDMTNER